MESNKEPQSNPVPPGEPFVDEDAPPPKMSRLFNWRIIAILVIAVACLLLLTSRHSYTRTSQSVAPVSVAVARVARENLSQAESFEAEFRPYQEIDLHAKVAGFVQSINVDIGDVVKQGQLLATLEIPELKEDIEHAQAQQTRAEKQIKSASAAYDDAHLAYTRLGEVNKSHPNLVAQQDLDTALERDSAADATLAAAKEEVAVAKAEVDKLNARLDYCKITAPFAGVITKRYADEGALVQGGVTPSATAMPLVRLSQNDRLRLDFPVSVSYVEKIRVGDPVEIHLPALGKDISGKISRFTRKVNSETRTMEAEVDVTNADLSLTPGIYATANLTLDRRENVLAVPIGAIANRKAPTVFVLDGDNQVEERPVTLGLETANKIEVVAGLNENQLVMIGSRGEIKVGQKVQPKVVELGAAQ
jgi:RND family efflux transporter MFP subunit